MRKDIDTLIIGGTYFAIGYASKHPGCVIMESSQQLGGDFHHSMLPVETGKVGEKEASTKLAKMMRQEQVWDGENFDILKASPVLHRYVSEEKERFRILMDARVIKIESAEAGYQVTYMDNEGIHNVYCSKVLDTTDRRETYPAGAICKEKYLHLFLVSITEHMEQSLLAVCPDCVILPGKNKEERFVKFPASPDETMAAAYRRITELWKCAFPNAEERIMFVAEDFELLCEENADVSAPCPWMNHKFKHPLTAFCEGMNSEPA